MGTHTHWLLFSEEMLNMFCMVRLVHTDLPWNGSCPEDWGPSALLQPKTSHQQHWFRRPGCLPAAGSRRPALEQEQELELVLASSASQRKLPPHRTAYSTPTASRTKDPSSEMTLHTFVACWAFEITLYSQLLLLLWRLITTKNKMHQKTSHFILSLSVHHWHLAIY